MKNILVVLGGGRRGGNTEQLTDAFIRGAEDAGHRVEKISLTKTEIKGCLGPMQRLSVRKTVCSEGWIQRDGSENKGG